MTSQPSPCTPARLVLFHASSEHGRQSSPSWAGVSGRGSGGDGGGAGGQTQSVFPQAGHSTSPGHFCGGVAVGLQQMLAGLAHGSVWSRRCPSTSSNEQVAHAIMLRSTHALSLRSIMVPQQRATVGNLRAPSLPRARRGELGRQARGRAPRAAGTVFYDSNMCARGASIRPMIRPKMKFALF